MRGTRTQGRSRRYASRVEVPLTPLVDIVFLLLIYFLLTSNFMANQGLTVHLPESRHGAQAEQAEIVITVDRSEVWRLDGEAIDAHGLLEALTERAREADRPVIIRADREVPIQNVVRVMDIAKSAGVKRMFVATEPARR